MHAAYIGFVSHRLGEKFDYDGKSDLLCMQHRFVLAGSGEGRYCRNPVRRKELLRLDFSKDGATGASCMSNQRLGRCTIQIGIGARQHRRLIQSPQVVTVPPHVIEYARCRVRK